MSDVNKVTKSAPRFFRDLSKESLNNLSRKPEFSEHPRMATEECELRIDQQDEKKQNKKEFRALKLHVMSLRRGIKTNFKQRVRRMVCRRCGKIKYVKKVSFPSESKNVITKLESIAQKRKWKRLPGKNILQKESLEIRKEGKEINDNNLSTPLVNYFQNILFSPHDEKDKTPFAKGINVARMQQKPENNESLNIHNSTETQVNVNEIIEHMETLEIESLPNQKTRSEKSSFTFTFLQNTSGALTQMNTHLKDVTESMETLKIETMEISSKGSAQDE